MSGILTSSLGGRLPLFVYELKNVASPNIPALLLAAGWKGVKQPVRINITGNVNTLVLPSNGLNGWNGYIYIAPNVIVGGVKNGGTALRTQVPVMIENAGKIYGGGGFGGEGTRYDVADPIGIPTQLSIVGGAGGPGQGFASSSSMTISGATSGASGSTGRMIAPYDNGYRWYDIVTGTGGAGGAWGEAGRNGTNGIGTPHNFTPATVRKSISRVSSAAGYYIDGNTLVTWVANGDRRGRVKA